MLWAQNVQGHLCKLGCHHHRERKQIPVQTVGMLKSEQTLFRAVSENRGSCLRFRELFQSLGMAFPACRTRTEKTTCNTHHTGRPRWDVAP